MPDPTSDPTPDPTPDQTPDPAPASTPDPAPAATPAAKSVPEPAPAAEPAEKSGGGFMKFLVTVIVLGILGFLVWKFLLNNEPVVPVETAPAAVAEQVAQIDNSTAVSTLKDITKEANSTVNSIKDVASAQAAIPAIDAITKKTAAVGGLFKGAPDALKSELQAVIVDFAPGFTNKLEKVMTIPGVEDVVGVKIDSLISKFELFEL